MHQGVCSVPPLRRSASCRRASNRVALDHAPSYRYPSDHATTDIPLHRNVSASLLSDDLTFLEKWGKNNLVSFNQSKTKQAVISRKRNQIIIHPSNMQFMGRRAFFLLS